jgi:hypothetical protein
MSSVGLGSAVAEQMSPIVQDDARCVRLGRPEGGLGLGVKCAGVAGALVPCSLLKLSAVLWVLTCAVL